jgi:hypothetical protein
VWRPRLTGPTLLRACTATYTASLPLPCPRRRAPVAVLEQHRQHRRARHERARREGQQAVRRLGGALGRHNEQRIPAAPRSAQSERLMPTARRARSVLVLAPMSVHTGLHATTFQRLRQLSPARGNCLVRSDDEQSSALDLACLLFCTATFKQTHTSTTGFAQTRWRAAAMPARAGLRNRPFKEGI